MKIKDKVLIVEDEQSISSFISMILTANGYDTIIVNTGEEALTMISSHCPDLIVLDLGLPDMDGLEVLRSVRKWSSLPIVVVSARNHERDKVEALDYGADDYLVKPFGTSELLARIRTAIRHTRTSLSNPEIAQSGRFTTGDLVIDYDKHQVLIHGENARLTANEYRIVSLLGKYAGKVLTYDFIIKELWGPKAKNDNQILRVNMANIRKKLGSRPGSNTSSRRWVWATGCVRATEYPAPLEMCSLSLSLPPRLRHAPGRCVFVLLWPAAGDVFAVAYFIASGGIPLGK